EPGRHPERHVHGVGHAAVGLHQRLLAVEGGEGARQAGDHRAATRGARTGRPASRRCVRARATPSAASAGDGARSRWRSFATIHPTCAFCAAPRPTTVFFTSPGAYSATAMPASSAARRTTPRACPSTTVVRTFRPKKLPSTATASGRCRVRTSPSPAWIARSRPASGPSPARITPHSRRRAPARPGVPSTTPKPVTVEPGSTPSTFTRPPSGRRLDHGGVDVEVREDPGDVVQLLEHLEQAEQLLGLLPLEPDRVLRHHRQPGL